MLNEKQVIKTLKNAIETFGSTNQKLKAIQEMAELIKEITKELEGRSNFDEMIDELVDVEIMLSQLIIIYVMAKPSQVRAYKKQKELKLERLEKLINGQKAVF